MKVMFTCVAENRPDFFTKAYGLVLSVRELGGSLADAPFVVNFVGGMEAEYARELRALGAETRVVSRLDDHNAWANKLRMFEVQERDDFDVLLALDCDVVVVGDLAPLVSRERIRAKVADYSRLSDREWSALFGALEIPMPPKTAVATSNGEPMIPYFNSGVVFVPSGLCNVLHERWSRYMAQLNDLFERDRYVVPRQWHWLADQIALTCALHAGRLPYEALPLSANFPTHTRVHPALLKDVKEPLILHYHWEVDSQGFLRRACCPLANPYIDRYNRARARALGLTYHGPSRRPIGERLHRALHRVRRGLVLAISRTFIRPLRRTGPRS